MSSWRRRCATAVCCSTCAPHSAGARWPAATTVRSASASASTGACEPGSRCTSVRVNLSCLLRALLFVVHARTRAQAGSVFASFGRRLPPTPRSWRCHSVEAKQPASGCYSRPVMWRRLTTRGTVHVRRASLGWLGLRPFVQTWCCHACALRRASSPLCDTDQRVRFLRVQLPPRTT